MRRIYWPWAQGQGAVVWLDLLHTIEKRRIVIAPDKTVGGGHLNADQRVFGAQVATLRDRFERVGRPYQVLKTHLELGTRQQAQGIRIKVHPLCPPGSDGLRQPAGAV